MSAQQYLGPIGQLSSIEKQIRQLEEALKKLSNKGEKVHGIVSAESCNEGH